MAARNLLSFSKAIKKMLDRKSVPQNDKKFAESEFFYEIANSAENSLVIVDTECTVVLANNVFCSVTGYNADNLKQTNFLQLLHENNDAENCRTFGNNVCELVSESFNTTLIIRKKNGLPYIADIYVSQMLESKYRIIIITDCKQERKYNREKEELLEKIKKTAKFLPGFIYQFRLFPDGSICYPFASEGIRTIYGVSPDDVREDASIIYHLVHPEDLEYIRHAVRKSAIELGIFHEEYRIPKQRGKTIWVESHAVPHRLEDGSILWNGYLIDITERKKAEEKVHKSANRFHEMMKNVPGVLYEYFYRPDTGEHGFAYVSEKSQELLGISNKPETFQEEFLKGLHESYRDMMLETNVEARSKTDKWSFDGPFTRPDGKEVWLSAQSVPYVKENEISYFGFIRDVTEYHTNRQELLRNQQFLDIVFSNVDFGIIVVDVLPYDDFKIVGLNAKQEKIMGLHFRGIGKEYIIDKTFNELIGLGKLSAEAIEKTRKNLIYCRDNKIAYTNETSTTRPDRSRVFSDERFTPLVDENNSVYRIITTALDVTEKELAKENLLKNEQFLNSIYMGSSYGVAICDMGNDGRFLFVSMNPSCEKVLDVSQENIIGTYVDELSEVYDRKFAGLLLSEMNSSSTLNEIREFKFLYSEHSEKTILVRLTPVYDNRDRIYRIILSIEDITEKVQAEMTLRQNEMFLNTIYSNVPYGIMVIDVWGDTFKFVSMNAVYEQMINITSDKFVNTLLDDIVGIIPKSAVEESKKRYRTCVDEKRVVEFESVGNRYGNWSSWLIRITPILNENNEVYRLIITTTDITQRAQAEKALRTIVDTTSSVIGRDFFTSLVSSLADTLFADYVFIGEYISNVSKIKTISHFFKGEVGTNVEFDLEDTICDEVIRNGITVVKEKAQVVFPDDYVLKDFNINGFFGVPLHTSDNKLIGVIAVLSCGTINDVDFIQSLLTVIAPRVSAEFERVRAEAELMVEKEYTQTILESIPAIVVDLDMEGTVISINEAIESVTGFTRAELIGNKWHETMLADTGGNNVMDFYEMMVGGTNLVNYQVILRKKDGEECITEWNVAFRYDEQKIPAGITGIGVDVTKERKREEEIKLVQTLQSQKRSLELRNELLRLSQNELKDFRSSIKEMILSAAQSLKSEYVSYWEIIDQKIMKCMFHYNSKTGTFADMTNSLLNLDDIHLYYQSLLKAQSPVIIENVLESEATRAISDTYFNRFGIVSLLDMSVWHNGKAVGVISLENRVVKHWQSDELGFVTSLARMVTYNLERIERDRTERALTQSEGRFSIVFEGSPLPMLIMKLSEERKIREIVDVNPAWVSFVGISRNDALGKTIFELGIEESKDDTEGTMADALGNNESIHGILKTMFVHGGQKRSTLQSFSVLEFKGEKHCFCVIVDVEQQKEAERRIEEARVIAEQASKAKSEFLANMSHEIRTPMNAILGFTEILREKIKDNVAKKHLDTINSSGRTLLSLINDILDLAKIEAGKLQLSNDAMSIRSLLEEVQRIFYPKLQEKELELVVIVDATVPSSLILDEIRLRQVLFNIIGNAIKFTKHGYVSVSVKLKSTIHETEKKGSENNGEIPEKVGLIIDVKDTGIGIEHSQLDRIFEAFVQQEGQSTRKYGGTGLGLTITRRIIEAMGGEISVQSTVGIGSVFTISLPDVTVNVSQQNKEHIFSHVHIDNLDYSAYSVLIVDDMPENRELFRTYVEPTGIKVYEAEDGLEAVESALKYLPSIIFMDLRMPVMNGFEAINIIKNKKETSHIPIITVTASVLAHEEENVMEVSDEFLRKPVNRTELLTKVSKFLGIIEKSSDDRKGDSKNNNKNMYSLSEEEKERYRNKSIELLKEFDAEWKILSNVVVLSRIKKFAHTLKLSVENMNLPILESYSESLISYCDQVDIIAVKNCMKQFPEMLQSFIGEEI